MYVSKGIGFSSALFSFKVDFLHNRIPLQQCILTSLICTRPHLLAARRVRALLTAVKALVVGPFINGWKYPFAVIYKVDADINNLLFNDETTCFPDVDLENW